MVEPSKELTMKLLKLIETTKYKMEQRNGQRKYGPPPDHSGPPPPKGCEVFVGKLPREIFEDELVPIFSKVGKIYEMRLMMDFSGSNRGYAFVTFTTKADAAAAVTKLNGYEIRPGRHIGVVKSVDNCRLFVGGIPKTKTKEEVMAELTKHVAGIVEVILYVNCFDRRLNRGFAFVEFTSHRAAAMARRLLVPGCFKLWDGEVKVDWAEPEPDVDEGQMSKVKVLYARNFKISTTTETIQTLVESMIGHKIERVKKIYDYAFIHFFERTHAEVALAILQNAEIDGANIEVKWSKPVDRELYRIQKMHKGNAKFNNAFNLTNTLMLYKQHLEKGDYINSSKDEGISSGCAGDSACQSPTDLKADLGLSELKLDYFPAPAKLIAMCKRYSWAEPIFQDYLRYDTVGGEFWTYKVELPSVGQPLLATPSMVGPFFSRPCRDRQVAYIEAAEMALNFIKNVRSDIIQQATPAPLPSFPSLLGAPSPQNCFGGLQYDYLNAMYQMPPQMPIQLPYAAWRAA